MENGEEFTDYYNLLNVDPNCDTRILEIAYHHFAKLYHPDHAETADTDKFNEVVAAYRTLKDPEKRAAYDRIYLSKANGSAASAGRISDFDVSGHDAVSDAELQEKILLYLYKKRRENPHEAGVAPWIVQEVLECPEDHFEFHIWYLKSKDLIETTEQGTLAISIEGVDQVISLSRVNATRELLLAKADKGGKDKS